MSDVDKARELYHRWYVAPKEEKRSFDVEVCVHNYESYIAKQEQKIDSIKKMFDNDVMSCGCSIRYKKRLKAIMGE